MRGDTPSVKACGFATFPKGTAFSGGDKISGIAIRRPLEGRLPPLRGKMSRSDKRGNLASVARLRGYFAG